MSADDAGMTNPEMKLMSDKAAKIKAAQKIVDKVQGTSSKSAPTNTGEFDFKDEAPFDDELPF